MIVMTGVVRDMVGVRIWGVVVVVVMLFSRVCEV